MDAAPQDQEQQYQQEEDEFLEMEEKRIVIVRCLTSSQLDLTPGMNKRSANEDSSPAPPKQPLRSSLKARVIRWGMRCGSLL